MTQRLLFVVACLALGSTEQTILSKPGNTREVLYVQSQRLTINCDIITELGNNVKYEWRKDGEVLPSNSKGVVDNRNGTLRFASTDSTTEGVYECLAKSDLGVASSGQIRVKRGYINIPQLVTQTHTPVRGEPFELSCPQVDAYPQAEITWLRQKTPIEDSPKKQYINARTTIGPNGHLYFANVTDEDVSKDLKYLCVTLHPTTMATVVVLAEHVIEGLKEAKPVLNKAVAQYVSKDVVAKEGDSIFLYCIFGGALAPPDYFFEGRNVNGDDDPVKQRVTRHNRSKGRRLIIRDVWLSDQGSYSCKISDADGTVTEKNMTLTVISAPTFLKKAETKTNAKLGSDVTISYEVKTVSTPKFTWTYNAKPLPAGGKIKFTGQGKPGEYTLNLEIKGVEKADAGYYGCKIANENGEIYAETLLSVA